MAKAKKNYINNAQFFDAMVSYKKACVEAEDSGDDYPIIPNYIGECLYQISYRLATKPNFSGYSYKDEMISDGLENAVMAVKNFDPEKSANPFAYFTQVIYFAFLRRIEKEKKQLYIKHKVVENSVMTDTAVQRDANSSEGSAGYIDLNNDYMSDFVGNFEATMQRKKDATKEAALAKEKDDT